MKVVSRKAWGARAPRPRSKIGSVRGVAYHYSGGLGDATGDHSKCAPKVRAFQRMHMAPGGLGVPSGGADIAYNWIVCPHGYVFVGRGWGLRSGANGTSDANEHYLAVCYIAGDRVNKRDLTAAARQALVALTVEAFERYPRGRELRPHSHFVKTACPGNELRQFLVRLGQLVKRH